jgi:diguanylate cyclase (GGDEF)-like protein
MNLVARYGGDEFVGVLTDSTDEGARHYVQRVLERVAADPTLCRGGVEVTWGISTFRGDAMRSADDLVEAADADFYRRKYRQAKETTDEK